MVYSATNIFLFQFETLKSTLMLCPLDKADQTLECLFSVYTSGTRDKFTFQRTREDGVRI